MTEMENIQRSTTYNGVSWDKFKPYGFTSETELLPAAIQQVREERRTYMRNALQPSVGYGPVIISLLEDQGELILNFLSTIDRFFKSEEQRDFLPNSAVYTVWATSPQDLVRLHKTLIEDLNIQGYKQEDINFLNIFDNATNHIEEIPVANSSEHTTIVTKAGQKPLGLESGGQKALRYMQKQTQNNITNATIIQTSGWNEKTATLYKDLLEAQGSEFSMHPGLQDDQPNLFYSHFWHTIDSPYFIQSLLNELWSTKKISVLSKILNQEILKNFTSISHALETTNKPLLQIIEAFNSFIKDLVPANRIRKPLPLINRQAVTT